jgi:hypothetical protein
VAAEGVLLHHEIECGIELLRRDVPCDEAAVGELIREKSLAHAADDTRAQHRLDAFQHRCKGHTALFRDEVKRMTMETFDLVLRDSEDLRIHRVGVLDGDAGRRGGHGKGSSNQ